MSGSMPMPVHERFYKGTKWIVAAGPPQYMGLKVQVSGEVYERDGDLFVPVCSVFSQEFEAEVSWLS